MGARHGAPNKEGGALEKELCYRALEHEFRKQIRKLPETSAQQQELADRVPEIERSNTSSCKEAFKVTKFQMRLHNRKKLSETSSQNEPSK